MPDVDTLLSEYIADHSSGGKADPRDYLAQVEGADRRELEALIDAYLLRSPGKAWDPKAYAGSRAEAMAERISADWGDESVAESWRELLPALRNRAELLRRQLVERLAAGIGHPEQTARVEAYYHQMENGKLPAEGVSDRVLDTLGEILGESAERLRAAGRIAIAGQADAGKAIAFARKAVQDPAYGDHTETVPGQASPAESDPEAAAVDELFTGGP